jgi:hemerythrin superfamily protein
MADDTNQQAAADRSRVAAGEGYEVAYFAQKHGLTQKAARELIAEVGNDREKLDAAAAARTGMAAKAPATRRGGARSGGAKAATASGRATSPKGRGAAKARPADKAAEPPVLAAVMEPVVAGAKTARRGAVAAAKPASAAAAPAARTIAIRAKDAMASARRSSASARQRVAAAPAAVGRRAGKAIDATKTAATSRTAALIGAAAAGLFTGLAVSLGRKAIVQAPSVMAGDWFEALKTEHGLALTIFDQIERTTDAEPARRTMLLTQLKHALGKHAFTEENVIYPALRDWGDKADADKLNHDHGYVKQYLYELDALGKSSPAFLVRVAAFRADLEAHIREEEDAIFPPLHAALGEAKNAEITALANREGFKLA